MEKTFGDVFEEEVETKFRLVKNIYIDSTQVKNINGQDCVGPNPTDRGRLGTKVSVICDDDEVPFYGANVLDARTTLETVENVVCPLRIDRRTTIDLICL